MHLAAVTAVSQSGGWVFASVAGFDQLATGQTWRLEDATWVGLVLITQLADGTWQAAVQGTPDYETFLAAVPGSSLSAGAKIDLSPTRHLLAPAVTYRFPWTTGTKMEYGILGIHPGDYAWLLGDYKAVDLLSDGDTSQGHSPNLLLAAASGTIDYVCDDGVNVAIRIGTLLYLHLLPNPNLLAVGHSFNQGDAFGPLKTGSFSSSCGHADQGPNWFHVHWAFPNTGSFQAGGWTLLFSDQMWHRGTDTVTVTQWLRSEVVTWNVQYFTDSSLTANCYTGTEDASFMFKQWFASPPTSGCPANTFGARFTKQVSFQGGNYTIHLQRAGQARVLLDGQPLINLWPAGDGGMEATRALTGTHEVRVEYAGTATLSPTLGVWWYGPGALPAIPTADSSMWRAVYYGNRTLWGTPALVQNESGDGINHSWGEYGAGYGLPAYDWSARFTRNVDFTCGVYRFSAHVDDGVRLWVGNHLIIDQWRDQVGDFTADLDMTGGSVPVKVEYYQRGWGAALTVNWQLVRTTACGVVLPDLRPYTPADWAGAVVASPNPGTHLTGTLVAGQPTYFDWAIINDGYVGTSANIDVELWIDNVRSATFTVNSLEPGLISTQKDWSTAVATPGLHTVKLVIDPADAIAELDETNNVWQGTFYWQAATLQTLPSTPQRVYVPLVRDGGN
jgi:hypothetical protein